MGGLRFLALGILAFKNHLMVSNGGRERWWAGEAGVNDSPHSVLGITRDATPNEVQEAYRTQMKACHPDLSNADSSVANEARARQLNAAMEDLQGVKPTKPLTTASHYCQWPIDRPVSSSERYAMFCERQPGRVMSARNNLRLRAVIMLTLMSIATYKRMFPDPDSPYYRTPKQDPPEAMQQNGETTAAATMMPGSRAAAIAVSVAETMQRQTTPAALTQLQKSKVSSERWDRL